MFYIKAINNLADKIDRNSSAFSVKFKSALTIKSLHLFVNYLLMKDFSHNRT